MKSLLTNEAAGYVASIKTEEANYEVAVDRLKFRSGKDEVQKNLLATKLTYMHLISQIRLGGMQCMTFVQLCEHMKSTELLQNNMEPF